MEIKLYKPTAPQVEFYKLVNEKKPFISLIVAGRQTGKSFFMMNDALYRSLNNKKHRCFWVSPIQDQANKVMKDIEAMFINHQELFGQIVKRFDRKNNEVYFYNGSFIKFRSADSGDNLRGATLDYIYIDEAAYMSIEFINEVLLPMVTRTGGRVCMASTFNGKNWFWDKYNDGIKEENAEEVISIKKTYLDLNDPAVDKTVSGIRKSMTKSQFDQEFLCRPVAHDALFQNIEDCIAQTTPDDVERTYLGMDIGVAQDYTVLTALDQNYNIIDIDRFHYRMEGMNNHEFKQRIKDFYHKWNNDNKLAACYFEINNNNLLFEELSDDEQLHKLVPFQTTANTKPEIIRNLIRLFDNKEISIPNNDNLIRELYDFKSKRNPVTGNMQFSNTDGKHDDMVMSLAIAAWCCKEEQDGGITMFL
jgi:phage terminase large subunit